MNHDSEEAREELRRAVSPRYQVGEEIGVGGMAFVYRGWDTAEHRSVAFKVLRRHYASALGPKRFLREIRIVSQLHHPNILPLLDSGHSDELFYFVMPLVEGETLGDRLEREPQLPLEVVRRIVTQVAAGLDYAHEAGVIHRDIKPSNLFLAGDQALVADFGIAKDLAPPAGETTTSTGLVMGTVQYMSPEQADGESHSDRRTDVYSLGCVAFEMVAGEPPFTGPNSQAVIARVRSMPAPSVELLRPDLPRGVDAVIRKALAKSPADRYQRAGDFADALSDPAKLETAAREARNHEKPLRRWMAPTGVGLALLVVGLVVLFPSMPPLDSTRVVVFPLGGTPAEAAQEAVGIDVALMIGSALEYTEPLRWIDGLPLLDATLRGAAGRLSAANARRITRTAAARWYLDGEVVRRGDSVTVVVRMNDAAGDSVVGRASATRVGPEAAQAGLEAVNLLLPRLLAPGQRMSDLSALADRRPAAVATWLQGEREYRTFNFTGALDYFRRALHADSALAVAALRGAQAANWLNELSDAAVLSDIAVRNISLLPGRVAAFTRGLHAYVVGQADSAVHWLTLAIRNSPEWTEAHMTLGETYYHLLPATDAPLDSLAEAEFTAAAADSGFSPARFHLAEIAIRSGDMRRADRAVNDFVRMARDDATRALQADLLSMFECARAGRKAMDWRRAAAASPVDVVLVAKRLAVGGFFPGCAEDGFRVVFDNRSLSLDDRWGAFLGLQGLLAAEGRTTELRALVDTAVAGGLALADQLYVLDALAGVPVETEAATVVERESQADQETARASTLWLVGEWRARAADRAGVESVRAVLSAKAAKTGSPASARFADVLAARLLLLQGDTTAAIGRLRTVLGHSRREGLDWTVGESLAPDRLLLAELLLARGLPREAIAAGAVFDHPAPAVFLPYLPASLALRHRAATALGQEGQARRFQDRLDGLGQRDRLARGSSPLSKPEAQ